MDWKKYIRDRLAPLNLGDEREFQMIEEMAQHLEAVYQDALDEGASEQQAIQRAEAHVKDWKLFECELILAKRPASGLAARNRAHTEGQRQTEPRKRGTFMGSILEDLRYGARMLLKTRGLTTVAVLSLALGIGANTAIFSLVDAVLLKNLPVRNPGELVLFAWTSGKNFMATSISGSLNMGSGGALSTSTSFSYDTFERFRAREDIVSDAIAFAELEQLNVNVDGHAELAGGQLVSGGYYRGLGIQPTAGRVLTDADDQPAADSVAVMSYRYWQRRFGSDTGVIGKSVRINGVPFVIVGIHPQGFEGTLQVGASPDLTIPLAMEPRLNGNRSMLNDPGAWWLQIMARPKSGATMEQIRASLEPVFQQSASEGYHASITQAAKKAAPGEPAARDSEPPDVPTLTVSSGSQGLTEARKEYGFPLLILMGVVALVLLIACANVATMLLSLAAARHREIAVRLALGASRRRLIRQLLTESVLMACMGGAVGTLLAYLGRDWLLTLRPWGGAALDLDLALDFRVLGFTFGMSLVTGVVFGLAPALKATRVDLSAGLKDNAWSVIRGGRMGLSKALIIAQIAMSLLLLIGAGLFVRTLTNLKTVDVGFNTANLLLFRVDPRLNGYPKEKIPGLYQQILDRIDTVPGVVRATVAQYPFLSNNASISRAFVEGQQRSEEESGTTRSLTWIQHMRANFLDTMEIPIVSGRGFTDQDDKNAPRVGVINQAMARKHFGDEDPIGKRFGFESAAHSRDIVIVGVAQDAKYSNQKMATPHTVYLPYLQKTDGLGRMWFAVRTGTDPALLAGAIREAVREVDPDLPLYGMTTQIQLANEALANERLFATLSVFFGSLAVLMVCLGVYGVMSFGVARRTNEIGIRMALGAKAPDVTRMVMRETMVLVVAGAVIGLGAAIATTRFIESMLFGLTPTDPLTLVFGLLLMIALAGIAGYLPARRASRIDPMTALRYE